MSVDALEADSCLADESDEAARADQYIFAPSLLLSLDVGSFDYASFPSYVTVTEPWPGLIVRPLCRSDYEKGFVELLRELTTVGDLTREKFDARFESMRRCAGAYFPVVVEDTQMALVVGSATLVVEQKFIHACAVRGRLEDVVVSRSHRGKQLGKFLIAVISLLARHLNCYKITLDCHDDMTAFYAKLGYVRESQRANYMTRRFQ